MPPDPEEEEQNIERWDNTSKELLENQSSGSHELVNKSPTKQCLLHAPTTDGPNHQHVILEQHHIRALRLNHWTTPTQN